MSALRNFVEAHATADPAAAPHLHPAPMTVAQENSPAPTNAEPLTDAQVQVLTGAQIRSLTKAQLQSLTDAQLQSLTKAQLQSLTDAQLLTLRDAEKLQVMAKTGQLLKLTDAQIQAIRKADIEYILHGAEGNAIARWGRLSCVQDDEVAGTAKTRADGRLDAPGAVASCLAGLRRSVRDGDHYQLYVDLLSAEEAYDKALRDAYSLPQKVVNAIGQGKSEIEFRHGKHVKKVPVTSGLALDVGYTGGYADGGNPQIQQNVSPERLRQLTKPCVAQKGNNRVCFTVGYLEGSQAWQEDNRQASAMPQSTPNKPQPSKAVSR